MKDIIKALAYTLTNPVPGPATWVTIPMSSVLSDNASPFAEEAQYAGLLNGGQRIAATDGSAAYPVILDPAAVTALTALIAALNDGTPVWMRETLFGGETIVVGGETGCTGGATLGRGGRGGFVMKLIQLYSPGAETGDGYALTP